MIKTDFAIDTNPLIRTVIVRVPTHVKTICIPYNIEEEKLKRENLEANGYSIFVDTTGI